MANRVFVLDTNRRPLDPVHPGRARNLLNQQRAAVFRRYPFTIIMRTAVESPVKPLRVKIDPGSKTTGLAIVDDESGQVVFAAELTHRGQEHIRSTDPPAGIAPLSAQPAYPISKTSVSESDTN